ncbi:MAG: hypothetical protein ACE5KX_00860 [Acidimicrobiia bacterium]
MVAQQDTYAARRHATLKRWRVPSEWIALLVLATACTGATSGPAPDSVATFDTSPSAATTEPAVTTRPPPTQPSITVAATSTTVAAPPVHVEDQVSYAVVAAERSGALSVLARLPAQQETCSADSEPQGVACGPVSIVQEVEVPDRPHNLAAYGSVVIVTHPRAGLISRYDVATGELISATVGIEPHDAEFSADGSAVYVADEQGRRLLTVDPATLELLETVGLPGNPHDLAVADDAIWATLVGRGDLAKVRAGTVELFPTGHAPHDLVVDSSGHIWFSNWGSSELLIFDPETGEVVEAPAGVKEPHHFALDFQGTVWVSDNGGAAVVGFRSDGPITTNVGPVPHHLGFLDDLLVVAVSGAGQVVVLDAGEIVGRIPLSRGLHGVAIGRLAEPAPWQSDR